MRGLAVEPPNEPLNVTLLAPDRSHDYRWKAAVRLDVREGDEVLVDVQTDKNSSARADEFGDFVCVGAVNSRRLAHPPHRRRALQGPAQRELA